MSRVVNGSTTSNLPKSSLTSSSTSTNTAAALNTNKSPFTFGIDWNTVEQNFNNKNSGFYFNNCTVNFVNNNTPNHATDKTLKRKRLMIYSDSESSQEI